MMNDDDRRLPAGTEETRVSQCGKTVSGPRFETRAFRIRVRYDVDSIRNHVLRLLHYVARLPVCVVRIKSLILSHHARVSIAFVVNVCVNRY